MNRKGFSPRIVIGVVAVIVVVGVIGYFGISFYIADTLSQSTPDPNVDSSAFVATNVTNVTFPATDGVILHGWLFQNTQPNSNGRIVIHVAGLDKNRSDDDYYMLFIAHDLYEQGYSILLYDQRDTGTPAPREDFGQTSGNDVLGAVNFAEQNGFAPQHIGIIADSMGTVSTLMVIDKLNNVGPIVIDSGIARMQPLMELVMTTNDNVPSFLFPGIFLMAKYVYNIDAANTNPVDQITSVPNRVFLFLVGAQDTYVPPVNSEELLKAANPASKLVVFPDATHAHTFRSDPDLYLSVVTAYFNQYFAR